MRKHFLIKDYLFEDGLLVNKVLRRESIPRSFEIASILDSTDPLTPTTNISLNALNYNISFNNFHDYLGNSFSIIYLTILVFICIEILIGNGLLIYTVLSNKLFGKLTTRYVMLSLAVSDFLIGLIIIPYFLCIFVLRLCGTKNSGKTWHYEAWSNLDSSLTTASIYSLCLVTLDRYLAITRPLQYTRKISHRKVKYYIVIIWILSILTTFSSSIIMWILNFLIENDDQREITKLQVEKNLLFHIVLSVVCFYFPFFLILFFNVSTYLKVKNRLKQFNINKIENSNRSSQRLLIQSYSSQSNMTIASQPEQQSHTANNSQNDLSNNSSKLCLKCFTNQDNISVISGSQVSDYNNNGSPVNQSKNGISKKKFPNRRCSLCSCRMAPNSTKKETVSPSFTSIHFSLTSTCTWRAFHRNFIEKLQQKQKEGLTKNYKFASKEFKLIKFLIIINVSFSVCWLPIYTYQELLRFNFVRVDNHLLNYLLLLGW